LLDANQTFCGIAHRRGYEQIASEQLARGVLATQAQQQVAAAVATGTVDQLLAGAVGPASAGAAASSSSPPPLSTEQLSEALLPVIAPLTEHIRQLEAELARLAKLVAQERAPAAPAASSSTSAAAPRSDLSAFMVNPGAEARSLEERSRAALVETFGFDVAVAFLQGEISPEDLLLSVDTINSSTRRALLRRELKENPTSEAALAAAAADAAGSDSAWDAAWVTYTAARQMEAAAAKEEMRNPLQDPVPRAAGRHRKAARPGEAWTFRRPDASLAATAARPKQAGASKP